MAKIPEQPFLTLDFSLDGGGVDFLGMRWVNLQLLTEYLIPGINNATRDFGTYCLATWIPSKFRSLCQRHNDFVYHNFTRFQESVEVAMSHAIRSHSPATSAFGATNRAFGTRQKLRLPGKLSFVDAARTHSTSVYSAPLYGPSLKYLGLIQGEAAAQDGTSTKIPLAYEDPGCCLLVEAVETALSKSKAFSKLARLEPVKLSETEIDDLGFHGLHPGFYRDASKKVKRAFLEKFLPKAPKNGRTLTAELLLHTLTLQENLTENEVRAAWHTGQFSNGQRLGFSTNDLSLQREYWAIFQARQYQRWIVEDFMWCFEDALLQGCSTMDAITEWVISQLQEASNGPTCFRDVVMREARQITRASRFETISEHWDRQVHGAHPCYIDAPTYDDMDECDRALRMLARWWIRTLGWLASERHKDLLVLGGEERISARCLFQWIMARIDKPLSEFVRQLLEELVFAQHIRVALSRFDGNRQRLRFAIGDGGIVPTRSAMEKLAGDDIPGWTADRLLAFTDLLCDLSVVARTDEGGLSPGEMADWVTKP
jgi:hypothetical protein